MKRLITIGILWFFMTGAVIHETNEMVIERGLVLAQEMSSTDTCRNVFNDLFGGKVDPYLELQQPFLTRSFSFPEDYLIGGHPGNIVYGYIECLNPGRIVFNSDFLERDGPATNALVWLHELVHLADCRYSVFEDRDDEEEVCKTAAVDCFNSMISPQLPEHVIP